MQLLYGVTTKNPTYHYWDGTDYIALWLNVSISAPPSGGHGDVLMLKASAATVAACAGFIMISAAGR